MKIHLRPQLFFKEMMGSDTEAAIFNDYRVISIGGGEDEPAMPFSPGAVASHNLCQLVLEKEASLKSGRFTRKHAKTILRFVGNGAMPLLIHAAANHGSQNAVGEILNWYFNFYLADAEDDYLLFYANHRQLTPDRAVCRVMLEELGLAGEYAQSGKYCRQLGF